MIPDIDRRIAALAFAILCALAVAYIAYCVSARARARASDAEDLAAYAAQEARVARMEIAAMRQDLPAGAARKRSTRRK